MTSHYMRCLVIDSFESVFDALTRRFGNVYSRRLSRPDETKKAVVLGEKLFLRHTDFAAVSIILEQHLDNETRIEIISYAGGKGLTDISYGAHSAYVHEVRDFLANSGFNVQVEDEIEYFSGSC